MSLASPPRPDELEVSLFGPGIGECVVVHIGGGEWITVDSCEDPESSDPVALTYLRSLRVDPATQIKRVIVTHWHDDHMRGAARVLAAATSAKFHCSGALGKKEFLSFVSSGSVLNAMSPGSSGVAEFSAILDILKARRLAHTRVESVGPEWTQADAMVYLRAESAPTPGCDVFALSPSSATVSRGLHEIAQQMQRTARMGQIRVRLPAAGSSPTVELFGAARRAVYAA